MHRPKTLPIIVSSKNPNFIRSKSFSVVAIICFNELRDTIFHRIISYL